MFITKTVTGFHVAMSPDEALRMISDLSDATAVATTSPQIGGGFQRSVISSKDGQQVPDVIHYFVRTEKR